MRFQSCQDDHISGHNKYSTRILQNLNLSNIYMIQGKLSVREPFVVRLSSSHSHILPIKSDMRSYICQHMLYMNILSPKQLLIVVNWLEDI